MKQFILTALLSTTILSWSLTLPAITGGHSSYKAFGETTTLIPEPGLATSPLKDAESANTNFPFGNFKAIATVVLTLMALTRHPFMYRLHSSFRHITDFGSVRLK